MQDKYLIENGKEPGSLVAQVYISYFFGQVNTSTLIQFLELWFSRFEAFQYRVYDNHHYFSIKHDISMKYSSYLELNTPKSLTFSFEF